MYRPGELDQVIEIFRRVKSDDGYGGEEVLPVSIGKAWAKVKPLSGSEKKGQDTIIDAAVYRFIIRNRSDLLETDMIRWNGQDFNIRFIPYSGLRNQYLEIEAEKGVAQ